MTLPPQPNSAEEPLRAARVSPPSSAANEVEITTSFPAAPHQPEFASTRSLDPDHPPRKRPGHGLSLPRRFGDYELLSELGRGGMGVVYQARQVSTQRLVALKLIRPEHLASYLPEERDRALARFRNEVQAAAQLDHDHVVTVYDVGDVDGQSYYAMRLVAGESLKDRLAAGPLEPGNAALYLEQIARALQEAHVRGILHRDVKPHNILIDAKTDRALLTDFGLAKLAAGDQELTGTATALGSPPYMAPEQTRDSGTVTAAADIYGLGATLYHLLTGRPPFQAASAAETMLQVQTQEPVSPRELNPAVTRDLETICLKCLEKEPAKRFASALDVADRLERVQRGEPIPERPISRWEKTRRWGRKHPTTALLMATLAMVLILATTVSTTFGIRARQSANDAQLQATLRGQERDRAIAAEKKALRRLYIRQISRANDLWDNNQPAAALKELAATQPELRGWEYDYLFARFHDSTQLTSSGWGCLAAHPTEMRVASGEGEVIVLRDLLTGEKLREFPTPGMRATRIAYSANGARLVAGGQLRTAATAADHDHILVWDSATAEQALALSEVPKGSCVAISPDGSWLAIGGVEASGRATIQIRDVASGEVIQELLGHEKGVGDVAISSDGTKVATAGHDRTVRVWDAAAGLELLSIPVQSSPTGLAICHQSRRLAWSENLPKRIRICDLVSGEELQSIEPPDHVRYLAFSGDNERLTGGMMLGSIGTWELSSGMLLATRVGHSAGSTGIPVAYSADGSLLVSGDLDGLRTWPALSREESSLRRVEKLGVVALAVSPSGDRLACGTGGSPLAVGQVLVWDTQSTQPLFVFDDHRFEIQKVCFAGASEVLISVTGHIRSRLFEPDSPLDDPRRIPGEIQGFNALTGKSLFSYSAHDAGVFQLAASPDGKCFATGSSDRTVKIWDVKTRRELLNFRDHRYEIESLAFSPDSRQVVSSAVDQLVVWNAASGVVSQTCEINDDTPQSIDFGSSGRVIGCVSHLEQPGEIVIWGADSGQQLLKFQGHGGRVHQAIFSADGKRIVSGGDDRMVKLWDADTGEEVLNLAGHKHRVTSVAFSPDGTRIYSGSWDKSIRTWDCCPANFPACEKLAEEYATAKRPLRAAVFQRAAVRLATDSFGPDHEITKRATVQLAKLENISAEAKD